MKIRTLLPTACAILLFASCGEDIEKSAHRFLDVANQCLSEGNYAEAKLQIDSIKMVYPKAFETRKEGIALMRKVEMAEAEQTLAFTDSLLTTVRTQIDAMVPRFLFEKDEQYQEIGNFLSPSQRLENNLERNYLRATVDEKGHMVLASLYRGSSYIHHKAIRVSVGDTYAQTPTSENLYESSDALAKTERNDFSLGNDGGIIAFIALHAGETVKVQYIGDKTYSTTLTRADTRAIADVYALAQLLQELVRLSDIEAEANRKISFIQSKDIASEPQQAE